MQYWSGETHIFGMFGRMGHGSDRGVFWGGVPVCFIITVAAISPKSHHRRSPGFPYDSLWHPSLQTLSDQICCTHFAQVPLWSGLMFFHSGSFLQFYPGVQYKGSGNQGIWWWAAQQIFSTFLILSSHLKNSLKIYLTKTHVWPLTHPAVVCLDGDERFSGTEIKSPSIVTDSWHWQHLTWQDVSRHIADILVSGSISMSTEASLIDLVLNSQSIKSIF